MTCILLKKMSFKDFKDIDPRHLAQSLKLQGLVGEKPKTEFDEPRSHWTKKEEQPYMEALFKVLSYASDESEATWKEAMARDQLPELEFDEHDDFKWKEFD